MRKIFKRSIEILDGTPANYGEQKQRGQSVMEMAFITPLLIILIVGIVEVGWFANNYLTLLEVSRVGARRGATLTGEFGPLFWNNEASLLPRNRTGGLPTDPEYDALTNTGNPGYIPGGDLIDARREAARTNSRNCQLVGQESGDPLNPYPTGFYNLILCQMLRSMLPLEIKNYPPSAADNPEDLTDDIVISAFAIQVINNNDPNVCNSISDAEARDDCFERTYDLGSGATAMSPINEYREGIYIPVVAGRYPANANECNVYIEPSSGTAFLDEDGVYERDPFDFIRNGVSDTSIDVVAPSTTYGSVVVSRYPLELAFQTGIEANPTPGMGDYALPILTSQGFDPYDQREYQRGWSFTGYHMAEFDENQQRRFGTSSPRFDDGASGTFAANLFCWGSNWTVYDVQERLLNNEFEMSASDVQNFRDDIGDPTFGEDPDDPSKLVDTRQYFANQGLVLVEIYWRHELLLDLPAFSPVFNALGGDSTVINVWSAFPVPSITPELKYNRIWQDYVDDPATLP
jgi:hypothetical protein